MRNVRSFLIVAVLACVFLSNGAWARSSVSWKPSAPLLFVGQQKDSVTAYLKSVSLLPGGFMSYSSIQQVEGLSSEANQGGGLQHAAFFTRKYPGRPLQLGLYLKGALDDIITGHYDRNIQFLGRWIKKCRAQVLLRIGYEFDLPENEYEPAKYKQAYRRIVDILDRQGVKNVSYVWHSANLVEPRRAIDEWYPGDEYVDWVGVSIFNELQFGASDTMISFARQHQKSFMIAESAPAGLYSARAKLQWFKHYFDFIKEHKVRLACYINCDWDSYPLFRGMNWGDTRVERHPDVKEFWERKVRETFR